MSGRKKWIATGIIIGLSALGIAVGRLYPGRLYQGVDSSPRAAARASVLQADPACNPLGRACVARDTTMVVALELPDAIKPLSPFAVQVHLAGERAATVERVAVTFAMADMDMGFNRFELRRQAAHTWRGEALLPVCSMGRRDWRATVDVAGEPAYVGEFHLVVGS